MFVCFSNSGLKVVVINWVFFVNLLIMFIKEDKSFLNVFYKKKFENLFYVNIIFRILFFCVKLIEYKIISIKF